MDGKGSVDTVKTVEVNKVLLRELIKCVEEFIENEKDSIASTLSLAECIKRIFYNRIKIFNKNVSVLHQIIRFPSSRIINIRFVVHFATTSKLIRRGEFPRTALSAELCIKGTPNIRKVFAVLDFMNEKSIEDQRLHFNKWLASNIRTKKLSNFLSFILSDTEHINHCYDSAAFIRSEAYQNALMNCVVALEANDKMHLSKIDPLLHDSKTKPGHRRSISQPFISLNDEVLARKSILSSMKKNSRTFDSSEGCDLKVKVASLRRSKSLTNINHDLYNNRPRSKSINFRYAANKFRKKVSFRNEDAKEVAEEVPFFDYREPASSSNFAKTPSAATALESSESKQNVPFIHLVKVDDIKIHTDYRYSPEYKSSLATANPPTSSDPSKSSMTKKRSSLFSFFDTPSVASKISSPESTSPTELFFTEAVVSGSKIRSKSTITPPSLLQESSGNRRKSSRQNLANFIHTINSSRHKVELERENLHFQLSEAIIAACEQLKWNKMFNEKFKIPKDCRIKQSLTHSPAKNFQPPPKIRQNQPKFTIGSVDDETESSLSSDEVPLRQRKSSSSTEEDIDSEITPQMECAFDCHSAEGIAMALMSKFKNQQLPSTNNLLWLVTETQAPQSLLPLPDSYPINPDEGLSFNSIRGNSLWAAPRQQIIFTIHPVPDRKRAMLQQNNRCAGCGIRIAVAYIHKLRYCDYIGKYFCSACHKNQVSVIPARVLNKWSFTLSPVSNFAYKWLDQIWTLPLFHVNDLNAELYQKVKALAAAREARMQLKYVLEFIKQCRFADKEQQEIMQEVQPHWIDDVDIWSMNDFMNVKNSTFTTRIQEIIKKCEDHIIQNQCELCNARGFICELCPNKKDIIFPWMSKVKRCVVCGSCFHEKCFESQCSKCERLKRRKRHMKAPSTAPQSSGTLLKS